MTTHFATLRRVASLALAFGLFVLGLCIAPPAQSANTCSAPGRDGPTYLAPTYFPGNSISVPAGTSSLLIGTARLDANASVTPLLPGDLVLVIQMQDGSFNNSNTSAFGDGSSGRGMTSLGEAGHYEFKTVLSNLAGIVTFTQPFAYSYTTLGATLSQGARRYQVIRVPQLSAVTISGTVTAPQWDGVTGGVYVIDVTGTLTLNGTIDVSGQGFRGGGAFTNGALIGSGVSDYANVSPLLPTVTPARGATKGEGIGGTPRFVGQQSSLLNGIVDLLVSGYPLGYDVGRGAPGNAGGGGDQHNAGGGGGGNVGSFASDGGGKGGFTYAPYSPVTIPFQTCTPFTSGGTTYYGCNGDGSRDVGGLGGAAISPTISRLIMGGGGGAGDSNNASDNPGTPQNNGGNGGGIIFVRAGAISGAGALKADGAAGQDSGKDGAGGGGAGGTIVVHTPGGSTGVTASARGGNGGRSGYLVANAGEMEGPGGGGGGGLVVTASGVSLASQVVTGGSAGTNSPTTTLSNVYGATAGSSGASNISAVIADPLGAACAPNVTVTKTSPGGLVTNTIAGTLIPYVITITNSGPGTADGVDLLDVLPTGLTLTTPVTALLNLGATGSTSPTNLATIAAPVIGTFSVPAGASVQLTFSATVAASVNGSVSNVGAARYLDPTRVVATAKTVVNSAAAVVTVLGTPSLAGSVYADVNHNTTLDTGESGTGVSGLYVKIAASVAGSCVAPATSAAAVDPTTGAYSIGAIATGSYCLILDNNNTLTDVTPSRPTGWVGTEAASGIRQVTVTTTALDPQNFGLYNGASLTGRVFTDNGAGSGTANDGIPNGGETGVAASTVNVLSGATTVTTTTTDGSGNYTLWIPAATTGSLAISGSLANATVATGGSAGTTGGTYARTSNATTFTVTAGQAYSGVNFGSVSANTLLPDGIQTAAPGSTASFAHAFTAGSAGTVTFSTASTPAPSTVLFNEALVRDSNCNGVADAGEPFVTAPIAVTAGQVVCVIVRESIPAGAPLGAQSAVVLSAAMNYSGASPALSATVKRTDTTVVSVPNVLQLAKQVRNVTQSTAFATSNSASPNDVLEYQLTVNNPSPGAVTVIVINDSTPAYTGFVSASCPGTLPAGVTACSVTAQPTVGAQGALQWNLTGSLGSGAQLAATYQIRVNQ